jgi:hypothetical protein
LSNLGKLSVKSTPSFPPLDLLVEEKHRQNYLLFKPIFGLDKGGKLSFGVEGWGGGKINSSIPLGKLTTMPPEKKGS